MSFPTSVRTKEGGCQDHEDYGARFGARLKLCGLSQRVNVELEHLNCLTTPGWACAGRPCLHRSSMYPGLAVGWVPGMQSVFVMQTPSVLICGSSNQPVVSTLDDAYCVRPSAQVVWPSVYPAGLDSQRSAFGSGAHPQSEGLPGSVTGG